jgi:hypothetical protein
VLSDVVAHYLDTVTEREFDGPFMALLAAHGFSDVHLLHGNYEFGKDLIAKRSHEGVVHQYAFQTKAGDLGMPEWRAVRSQIDEMRFNDLAHPSFDSALARAAVLVCTGRLTGGAPLDAQQYQQRLAERSEVSFAVWDRQELIGMLSNAPECGLAGSNQGALLGLIGAIDDRTVTDTRLERYTRRWVDRELVPLGRISVEAAVIANRLRCTDRLDLAALAAICLLRAARVALGLGDPTGEQVAASARRLFASYARLLWQAVEEHVDDPMGFARASGGAIDFIAYPVRCCRVIEILGLLGLLVRGDDPSEADQITTILASFIQSQPGASHPASDRWAVSLIAPALLLADSHQSVIVQQLESVVRWVADRYEGAPGLAAPRATPDEEIIQLFGGPLEGLPLTDRDESYIATVVLDVAALLGLGDLYNLARNDFLAVGANPTNLIADESQARYGAHEAGLRLQATIPYREPYPGVDEPVAPHHARAEGPDPAWDVLALSSLTRDRHDIAALKELLGR